MFTPSLRRSPHQELPSIHFEEMNETSSPSKYKIIGFGTPCNDIIVTVDQNFLDRFSLTVGSWAQYSNPDDFYTLVDEAIHLSNGAVLELPGGSSSNVIRTMARFSHSASFFCKIGEHPKNENYLTSMKRAEVEIIGAPSSQAMTQIAAFVRDSDGERIFRTYPNLSTDLSEDLLNEDLFSQTQIAYFEGFMLKEFNLPFLKRAMEMAEKMGVLVCLDLGCEPIAENFSREILDLLDHVDIVFSNKTEALLLLKASSVEEAGRQISCYSSTDREEERHVGKRLCVVKAGSEGASVFLGEAETHSPAFFVENVKDTNGAGDFFAALFLHLLSQGCSLETALKGGNFLGSLIVQETGAVIPEGKWPAILEKVDAMVIEDLAKDLPSAKMYANMVRTSRKISSLEFV